MKLNLRWIVMILIVVVLLLSACARESALPEKIDPSTVEEIEGSEFKRVTVTEKAAERLGLQTALVREEQVVQVQTVVGEVVTSKGAGDADTNQLWVRASLNETDFRMVARDRPARILPLPGDDDDDDEEDSDEEANGWEVEPDEALGLDDDEDSEIPATGLDNALYFAADSARTGLVPGQRVFVEVPLSGSEMLRKVIPYAALIYDTEGNTFVYVKEPNALSFVRHSVTVDFIEGDLAYLTEGPAVNSEVVTVGVAELYGTETGVSK